MDRANRIKIFKSMMYCLDDPKIPEKLEEWNKEVTDETEKQQR